MAVDPHPRRGGKSYTPTALWFLHPSSPSPTVPGGSCVSPAIAHSPERSRTNSSNVIGASVICTHPPTFLRSYFRCHAPTCAICSRTCNGCPPSTPPTPALTSSPSLPGTPLVSPFPTLRRPVLAMNTNTALDPTPPPIAGRRRKARDREEEEGGKADGDLAETEEGVLPGCGRTVCRNCATESTQRCVPILVL